MSYLSSLAIVAEPLLLKSSGLDIFKVSRSHSKTDDFALENNCRFTPLLKLKNPLTRIKGQDIFALIYILRVQTKTFARDGKAVHAGYFCR